MNIFGFNISRLRGGVHPAGHKEASCREPIRHLGLPDLLRIPLQQHVGAPAEPVVQRGDRVLKGQLLAHSQGAISAPVHAPTSGYIKVIGKYPAPHPSGLPVRTITLEPDGEESWIDLDPQDSPFELSPDDISERVAAAGIVGLGGAAFPSAVKLALSRKNNVKTLIINGGECEPYLTCDDRLMRERAADIVTGIRLIQHTVGARTALVGIEDNKPEAINAMRAATAGTDVEVRVVPAMYPMGWDKQMIQALLAKEVPADGRSAEIGVLVHNVATAYAVYEAVVRGRPLVSRVVTVSGGAVSGPSNLEVLIGTPTQALFDFCGGFRETPARMVMGGPMMGHEMSDPQVPVVKGLSGVLALTRAEISRTQPAPCIRCTTCVRACPVGLLPLEMAAHIRASDLNAAVGLGLGDCIGCGSCSYVCPSHIPLVHYFNYAQGELAAKERAKIKTDATRKLADMRAERLARIAREREAAAAQRRAAKEAEAAKKATEAQTQTTEQPEAVA